MKKILWVLASLFVLAALLIAIAVAKSSHSPAAEVFLETAATRTIVQQVKATGQVKAKEEVNISSPLIAKIERLYVREGETVEAGKRFLDLEKDIFVAAREDWRSRLAMASNEVQQSRIDLADAELKTERMRRLSGDGIATREQLEATELALKSARLRLERAEQSVTQAQANLEKAEADLSKTTLYSPIAGLVVALQAKEGEVVVSGTMNNPASVIARVADLSAILAEVDVDESEIVKVRPGLPVALRVDAIPDATFAGSVLEVGNSGYNRAGQADVTYFRVKVTFTAPDPRLRPGMSVRADIETASRADAVAVPIQAVVQRLPHGTAATSTGGRQDEVPAVFVLVDGIARQRDVTTGIADETHVEIASGVSVGDVIVTGPYRALKDLDDGEPAKLQVKKPKRSGAGGPAADEDDDEGEEL